MARHVLVLFAGLMITSANAAYLGEFNAGFGSRSYDERGYDLDLTYLSATSFLSAVQADGRPYRLAPFLDRQSLISAYWQDLDYESSLVDKRRTIGIRGDFQIGRSDFRLGFGMEQEDQGIIDIDRSVVSAGWYFLEHAAVSVVRTDGDRSFGRFQERLSQTELIYQQAWELVGYQFLFARVSWGMEEEAADRTPFVLLNQDRETTSIGLQVVYYPVQQWGVGVLMRDQQTDYLPADFEESLTSQALLVQYDPAEYVGFSLSVGQAREARDSVIYQNNPPVVGVVGRSSEDSDFYSAGIQLRF